MTPKSLRQPPPRRFENYILTRATAASIDLTNVHDTLFVPAGTAGVPYTDVAVSSPIDIGFTFEFDNVEYKQFAACTKGWMALVDPTTSTFSSAEVLTGNEWSNHLIRSTFTSQAVLLAPWFDDIRNVADDAQQIVAVYGQPKVNRINRGFETPPPSVSKVSNSVRYHRDVRSSEGRRLIVRWNSLSDWNVPRTNIRFEVVLYENGKIEYRYAPRTNVSLRSIGTFTSNEDASIGIFMPNGTDRWRDFSYGLGYRDDARQPYKYGGAVSGSYTDTFVAVTRGYTLNLRTSTHWPGQERAGTVFSFIPPMNRRRVLPRKQSALDALRLNLPTVARTGDHRRGNDPVSFDDRRTVLFTASPHASASGIDHHGDAYTIASASVQVNAPSMLQRFYGDSEPSVTSRQDLFVGDFEFTSSIARASVDSFIGEYVPQRIEPFCEHKLFENDPTNVGDAFFSEGSSLEMVEGLAQSLRSKTQIRFSLPVDHNCTLPGTASTIHYLNTKSRAWNVPQNSGYVLPNNASTNTSGVAKGDTVFNLTAPNVRGRILEDQRGFGPIGNMLASGSHDVVALLEDDQTDAAIGSSGRGLSFAEYIVEAMGRTYPKTVTLNEDYRATSDEVFTLPINHPFLIERAVIELPFTAGDGWFKDTTSAMLPIDSEPTFDFAGPALTVALFNQVTVGSTTRRELIMSGCITHSRDDYSEIVFSSFPPHTATYQIRHRGFRAFGGVPGAVVTPASTSLGYVYTGSVPVRCEAQTSNGVILQITYGGMLTADANANRQAVIDAFNMREISLLHTDTFTARGRIAYINPFGRAGTGFDVSGRSVFGKEFAITNKNAHDKIQNPFYLTGTNGAATTSSYVGIPTQFSGAIVAGTKFSFHTALSLLDNRPSPYLVRPNDKLILAVSKTRPLYYGDQTPYPYTSGSIAHDVTLVTGAVNIVLYGSMLHEGKEFHDTLNQPLASDAVHEVYVGNEPVIDQFECDYRDAYVSGCYDDVVLGSMITRATGPDGKTILVTGSIVGSSVGSSIVSFGTRGRAFGKYDSRSAPTPGSTEYDRTDSRSAMLQPYHERAGSARINQSIDTTERFWDSMMPAVNQCFMADGAGIFLLERDPTIPFGFNFFGDPTYVDKHLGFLWFDYQSPSLQAFGMGSISDGVWTWSYPFEPRYSNIPRQRDIERSFIANYSVNFGNNTIASIDPTPLQGFFFGPIGSDKPSVPAVQTVESAGPPVGASARRYLWTCDAHIDSFTSAGHVLTGSAPVVDAVKCIFGFGDLNNRIYVLSGSDSTYFGSTHFADFRRYEPDLGASVGGNKWCISPIIRGWKYGVYSGLPTYSRAYFRTQHYGQVRDMLEQRPYTKYYNTGEPGSRTLRKGTLTSAVTIKFVDASGRLTKPENTFSQNLSFEATSSVPYVDGETRNRPPINTNTLNANIVSFRTNRYGQVTL